MRRVLLALSAAVLTLPLLAMPAAADRNSSAFCTDGAQEVAGIRYSAATIAVYTGDHQSGTAYSVRPDQQRLVIMRNWPDSLDTFGAFYGEIKEADCYDNAPIGPALQTWGPQHSKHEITDLVKSKRAISIYIHR